VKEKYQTTNGIKTYVKCVHEAVL